MTLNEGDIVSSLQRQFPEISSASVVLPIFSQVPTVNIAIAGPSFVLKSQGQSYVVNSQGVATSDNGSQSLAHSLPSVEDQTGFKIEVGKQILSASEVAFINNIMIQSRHANVPVKSLSLPPLAQELNLYTTDQPYYVKFYLGGDSTQQIGQFICHAQTTKRHKCDPGRVPRRSREW